MNRQEWKATFESLRAHAHYLSAADVIQVNGRWWRLTFDYGRRLSIEPIHPNGRADLGRWIAKVADDAMQYRLNALCLYATHRCYGSEYRGPKSDRWRACLLDWRRLNWARGGNLDYPAR